MLRRLLASADGDVDLAWSTVARAFRRTGITLSLTAAADQARASDALDIGIGSTSVGFRGVLPLLDPSTAAPSSERARAGAPPAGAPRRSGTDSDRERRSPAPHEEVRGWWCTPSDLNREPTD